MMNRIGLSLDWDFFCREKPEWEFGHSETDQSFNFSAWQSRYLHVQLERECDIAKYADFEPLDLMIELENKNLIFPPDFPLGIADSHKYAFNWFNKFDLDEIIHLDAHHDSWPIYPKVGIDCGNWLTSIKTKTSWIHPTWKDPYWDPKPQRELTIKSWKDFEFDDAGLIVSVFLCRSAAWTPPHLDNHFGRLVELLTDFSSPIQLQSIPVRPDIDLKAIKKFRREMVRWQEDQMSDGWKKDELKAEEFEPPESNRKSESSKDD